MVAEFDSAYTPVGVLPQVAAAPPQASVPALVGQIVTLLQPALYEAQRQAARQTVAEHYSLPHATAAFVRLYEETLSG